MTTEPSTILETFGTIRPDGTLDLEQKLAAPPGRVKVRVELLAEPLKPEETLVEFVQRSRRELTADGHKFMNDDEVAAWVEDLRSDDDRIDDLYRQGAAAP